MFEFKMADQLAMTLLANAANTTTEMEATVLAIPMFSGSRYSVMWFRIINKWQPYWISRWPPTRLLLRLCNTAKTIIDMQVILAAILMFTHVLWVKLSIERD